MYGYDVPFFAVFEFCDYISELANEHLKHANLDLLMFIIQVFPYSLD